MFQQITYFPIDCVLTGPAATGARVKAGGAPAQCVPWRARSHVYRRYSELVQLRRCLFLKHPSNLVPPLPAKSITDSARTALWAADAVAAQRAAIQYFLDQLVAQ